MDVGIVDNPEKAREAARSFKIYNVEVVFLNVSNVSTYALSFTVLPIPQNIKVLL